MSTRASSILFCVLGLAFSSFGLSQGDEYLKRMRQAISLHDAAQTFEQEMESFGAFEKLAQEHPEDWRPAYWASFVLTQAARVGDRQEFMNRVQRSQELHDMAVSRAKNLTPRQQSDFHALQSLIHSFVAGTYWAAGDRENGLKHTSLENASLNKAIEADPRNPRVYVLIGTDLVSEGKRNRDSSKVLSGKVILQKAQRLFQESPPAGDIEPDWARGWVTFWLERATLNSTP